MLLIGALTAIGLLKVAQQTAITLSAYEVGALHTKVHRAENETVWLDTTVASLRSPITLAETMTKNQLSLIAWSELPDAQAAGRLAMAAPSGTGAALGDE